MSPASDHKRSRPSRRRTTASEIIYRSVSWDSDVSDDEDAEQDMPHNVGLRKRFVAKKRRVDHKARGGTITEDVVHERRQSTGPVVVISDDSGSEDEEDGEASNVSGTATAASTEEPTAITGAAEPRVTFVASNPSSFISMMRSTPIDATITNQPQREVVDTDSPAAFPTEDPSSTSSTSFPATGTALAAEATESSNDDNDSSGQNMPPPRALDPMAEHLLIAAGAIGAFILFAFIAWVSYRVWKKNNGGASVGGFPWKRKEADGPWNDGSIYMGSQGGPMYVKDTASGYYSSRPGSIARSGTGSVSQTGTLRQQQLYNDPALAAVLEQSAQQDGSEGTMRSRMPDSYYNQSPMARKPSDAYDPAQRTPYRASEISSLSSGFGDADIVVSQGLTAPPRVAQAPEEPGRSNYGAARMSMASRSGESRVGERRETIYTQTSEDRPARFRSISSWVDQQTGRVKRAHGRAQERGEVPVMPAIPGELAVTRQTAYR